VGESGKTLEGFHSPRAYGFGMAVKWLAEYLSLISEADEVSRTVDALSQADSALRKAKDILRAARLDLLPATNLRVKGDLAKIDAGKKLSPILLVRGKATDGVALEIADGYHRVCASYLTDENTPIPCRLVSWQS
jgi:hypothetical protein